MVRQELVPPWRIIEGDVATIRCTHGDTVLYPLANIRMEVGGHKFEVEAAVSTTLPASVLLGGDVPELKQLIGNNMQSRPTDAEDVMIVVTHAQAKRQLEEEILRREAEILSGAKTNPVGDPELPDPQDDGKDGPHPSVETTPTLTQEQRRTLQQQLGKSNYGGLREDAESQIFEFSADRLIDLQESDATLSRVREAVASSRNPSEGEFFKRDGLIHQRWILPGRGEEYEIEQLVLPKAVEEKCLSWATRSL